MMRMANSRGFTLIELLVVIGLMSILTLSSISVFFSYSKSQSFQTGVAEVVSLLNKAKSRSISQVKPGDCDTSALEGYKVTFVPEESDYQLEGLCGGSSYPLESKKLPSQVIFTDLSATSVVFEVSTGVVNATADVIIAGFGNSKTISIDGVGNISVQ